MHAVKSVFQEFEDGVLNGERLVSDLLYADNISLLASSEAELQAVLNKLDYASREFVLVTNVDKSNVKAVKGKSKVVQYIQSCNTCQFFSLPWFSRYRKHKM